MMAKAESLSGVQHVMNTGSQAVAHKDTIVPSIILRSHEWTLRM